LHLVAAGASSLGVAPPAAAAARAAGDSAAFLGTGDHVQRSAHEVLEQRLTAIGESQQAGVEPGQVLRHVPQVAPQDLPGVVVPRHLDHLGHVEILAGLRTHGKQLVETAQAMRARYEHESLARALAGREIVIKIFRPRELRWHLDVATAEGGPFLPSSIPSESGSFFVLQGARFGQTLYLAFNTASGVHVAPAGERCSETHVEVVRLDLTSGTLRFGDITLQYEVESGWPQWPPSDTKGA